VLAGLRLESFPRTYHKSLIMLRRIFSVALLTSILVSSSAAQAVAAKHSQVELISRVSAVAPGNILTLGVHFILEPGWHIYWINPGDSGQPPSLEWQLPPRFTAGETQWPRPEKLQSSPTLADYGYHDGVLLMVPIRVPAEKSGARSFDFAVQVKWLICREVCIPDHAQLKLTLPPGVASPDPNKAMLFTRTIRLLPRPWPAQWIVMAESRKENFLLTVDFGRPVRRAEFYPLDKAQVENSAAQQVKATPRGCTVSIKKSDLLLKPISTLRGVLVLDGQVFQINANVKAQVALK
jgi:DsbC/DsbD-like thiol-disulfide interchange protein